MVSWELDFEWRCISYEMLRLLKSCCLIGGIPIISKYQHYINHINAILRKNTHTNSKQPDVYQNHQLGPPHTLIFHPFGPPKKNLRNHKKTSHGSLPVGASSYPGRARCKRMEWRGVSPSKWPKIKNGFYWGYLFHPEVSFFTLQVKCFIFGWPTLHHECVALKVSFSLRGIPALNVLDRNSVLELGIHCKKKLGQRTTTANQGDVMWQQQGVCVCVCFVAHVFLLVQVVHLMWYIYI